MRKVTVQAVLMLAVGCALGYATASGKLNFFGHTDEAAGQERGGQSAEPAKDCCTLGGGREALLARADDPKKDPPARDGKKPNILVIMGDDIGWFNPSCYHQGVMGYQTPNIDRIAKEGARFTDWYGQQSCTAGRAAFVTGQSPIR